MAGKRPMDVATIRARGSDRDARGAVYKLSDVDQALAGELGDTIRAARDARRPFQSIFDGIETDEREALDAGAEEKFMRAGSELTERLPSGRFPMWVVPDGGTVAVQLYELDDEGGIDWERPLGRRQLQNIGIQSFFGSGGDSSKGLDLRPSLGVVLDQDAKLICYPGITHYFDPRRPENGALPYSAVDTMMSNAHEGFARLIEAENKHLIATLQQHPLGISADEMRVLLDDGMSEEAVKRQLQWANIPGITGLPRAMVDLFKKKPGSVELVAGEGIRAVTPHSFKGRIDGRMLVLVDDAVAVHKDTYMGALGRRNADLSVQVMFALDGLDTDGAQYLDDKLVRRAALGRTDGRPTTFYERVARQQTTPEMQFPVVAVLRQGGRALAIPRPGSCNPAGDFLFSQLSLHGLATKTGFTTSEHIHRRA